jgi:hypothetical protein
MGFAGGGHDVPVDLVKALKSGLIKSGPGIQQLSVAAVRVPQRLWSIQ